jgi:hypothetical protein
MNCNSDYYVYDKVKCEFLRYILIILEIIYHIYKFLITVFFGKCTFYRYNGEGGTFTIKNCFSSR